MSASAARRLRALGRALLHGAAESPAVTATPTAADSPEAVQIAEMGEALGIKFYLFCFTDLFGVLRSKLVPAAAVRSIATGGAGFAGFAAYMDMSPADGDVLCLPDPSSFTQLPWKKEVAWLACNPHHGVNSRHNGEEIDQAPRNVLRKQMAKLEAMGYELKTGVELEFFLLDANDTSQLSDPTDTDPKACYDQAALMKRYDFIAELVSAMEELGWGPYQADHEDGNGQFEVNWEFDNALVTADRHAFAKYMTKSIAQKHGYVASYMPKPFVDRAGSGLHAHITLHDETGANVFKEAGAGEYEVSPLGWNFLGGILGHAKALCAITNPTVNSYKRLNADPTVSGASWAPNTISYTGNNRTHMVRLPDAPRFELRLADAAVNPYLLPAGIAAAGLDGMANNADPGEMLMCNMYSNDPDAVKARAERETLPLYLIDALREFEQDSALQGIFGEEFSQGYLKLRWKQWNEYQRSMSAWEVANTLDC